MMEHSENNLRSEMEDLKSQLDNIKHAKVSIYPQKLCYTFPHLDLGLCYLILKSSSFLFHWLFLQEGLPQFHQTIPF